MLASAAIRKPASPVANKPTWREMLGVHRRTVQRCRDRLVRFGYLKPIGKKPGGNVSGYNIFTSKRRRWCRLLKKAALVPPLTTGKAALVSKEAALVSKKAVRQPHILPLKSLEIPCAPNHETEDGRASQPDGRGPHPAR